MVKFIYKTLLEFYCFLKNPHDNLVFLETSTKKKIYEILIYSTISILIILLLILFLYFSNLIQFFPATKISDLTDMENLFLGVIFAPILEEIRFRLFLKKNIFYVFIFIAFWLLSLDKLPTYLAYTLGVIIVVLIIFILLYWVKVDNLLTILYRKYFPYIFYFSAIIFALFHLNNFKTLAIPIWIIPLLVLPQFIMGLVFGYIRIKNGLLWSILTHSLYNSSILLLGIMLP